MSLGDPVSTTSHSPSPGTDTTNFTRLSLRGCGPHTVSRSSIRVNGSHVIPAKEERVRRQGCSDAVADEVPPKVSDVSDSTAHGNAPAVSPPTVSPPTV